MLPACAEAPHLAPKQSPSQDLENQQGAPQCAVLRIGCTSANQCCPGQHIRPESCDKQQQLCDGYVAAAYWVAQRCSICVLHTAHSSTPHTFAAPQQPCRQANKGHQAQTPAVRLACASLCLALQLIEVLDVGPYGVHVTCYQVWQVLLALQVHRFPLAVCPCSNVIKQAVCSPVCTDTKLSCNSKTSRQLKVVRDPAYLMESIPC